ncbi:CFEM domain-containing protein [Colletotrichum higginsianum]|nr:CFEM domain-containing protein [Colletotrichum higginsianum]
MRTPTSLTASLGLLWIPLMLSVAGVVAGAADQHEVFVGRDVHLFARQQLPDLSNISTCGCNLPHESQTAKVLAILIAVYTVAALAVGLRLLAKNLAKTWNLDDVLIISALVIAIAPVTFIILIYAAEIVYVFVLLLAKLSLVVFYLRIFTVRKFRIAAYILIGFLVVGQVVIGFLTIFSCHPIELFWNRDIHTGGCLDVNQLAYANSALAIIQDLIILALPIAMLPGLQMSRNKKISVAMVFLLGSVGFISTIIRLQVLAVFGSSIDPTWDYAPVVWWTTVELGVVIVCACAPMIRNLVDKVLPRFVLFTRWTSPKPSKEGSSPSSSGGSSKGGGGESPRKMGRYHKFGRTHSPPQFSDNYVRDHLTGPRGPPVPPKDHRTVPPTYRDMYAYQGGSKQPKALEPPPSPPQPFDLSWRSMNPYGIPKENLEEGVGKKNYNIDIEMLERKGQGGRRVLVEQREL